MDKDTSITDTIPDVLSNVITGHLNLAPVIPFGFPSHLTAIDELTQLITRIIFTGSVLNSSVNNVLFEYSCFAPNNPACMREKPPTESDRGEIDMKKILDSLPDQNLCAVQAGVAYSICNPTGSRPNLTQISPTWTFNETFVTECHKNFIAHLLKIENDIAERNKALSIPYNALVPSKLPQGMEI